MNPRKIILEINKTLRTNKLEQESKKKKEKEDLRIQGKLSRPYTLTTNKSGANKMSELPK